MKRTYQPKNCSGKKSTVSQTDEKTRNGRKVLASRKSKGRARYLSNLTRPMRLLRPAGCLYGRAAACVVLIPTIVSEARFGVLVGFYNRNSVGSGYAS